MNRVIPKPSFAIVGVVTECLCEVSERIGKEFGSMEMAKWYEAFAACEPFELREAFDNFALTSAFAPSMAAIRQELHRLRFGGISGAWLMVQQTAQACSGGNFFIVFEHAAIHFAVEVIGGWDTTIRMVRDVDRISFARRDFMKAFEDHRPSVGHPAGLGSFNGRNAVLIGHRERAQEVYRRGGKHRAGSFSGIEVLQPQVELLVGQRPQVWPEQLGQEHMAAPPGPPIYVSPPWWQDTAIPVPQSIGQRDNAA